MKGDLRVEIVIRNKADTVDWDKYGVDEMPSEWVLLETNYKLSINVPLDWKGFRDGTLNAMFEDFGDLVYVALAYYTDANEIITDGDGVKFQPYDVLVDSKYKRKYVKKRLRIIEIIDEENNIFDVKEFGIDVGSHNPVFKILDVYSCVNLSILNYVDFLKEGTI